MQMVVTMKNMALYPETNKTNIESVTFLHLWLAEYLSHHGTLALEVAKDSLQSPDGTVVYQERPGDPILAAPMFRDGIQTLIFEPDLTETELRTFLTVLLRFRNPSETNDDDLVGSLWECSLAGIRYSVASEYEQVGPEFELSAMKVAKEGAEYRDVDAPFGDDALAPQKSDNLAPVAKPIASLFALAGSSDLLGSGSSSPEAGGGQAPPGSPAGAARTESRTVFDSDGIAGPDAGEVDSDDGFTPFGEGSDDYYEEEDGFRPLAGSYSSADGSGAQSQNGSGAGAAGGLGGGNGKGGFFEAASGKRVKGKTDKDAQNAKAEEQADDDDFEFDASIISEAFKDLEKPISGIDAPEPQAQGSQLSLESLKERPVAQGPELAERLRQWNLNPKEIRQVGALINWDESRDASFDAMQIINIILASPITKSDHLPLLVNFMTNEIRTSLRRLELRYLNNFFIELGKRAESGGKLEAVLAQEMIKKLSSAELLSNLVDPGPSQKALEEGYEDLRWLLYQLPPPGINSLAALLGKAPPNQRLWNLLLEVISYETIKSGGKTINIVTQLNDRALAKVIEISKASLASLPSQLIQSLTRHKSGAVREATAKALMECDPESFHSLCAHMVLDSDSQVAKLVRPALGTRRNPAVESHLYNILRESYTRDRYGDEIHLLDNYRLYGNVASPRAVAFLEEVLLRKDFKTFLSRTVNPHKLGAALALFMMPHVEAARDALERAGRSSFRNVKQAYLEAERIAKGTR